MTTCPQCGAATTGLETCAECGQSVETAATGASPRTWFKLPGRVSRPGAIAVGIGVLGLVVGGLGGFGIGHARASDGGTSATAASGDLSLPDTLSGSYKRSTTIDTQIADAVASAQDTLGAGTDMALYTHKKKQVLVEATRLPGGAFLNAGMTYAKVGDDVCASVSGTSGSEAICTRSGNTLTVQVTATDSTIAAKYVDEVYAALA